MYTMLLTGPTKPAELGEWNTWLTYTIMALSIQCEREALLQTLGIPHTEASSVGALDPADVTASITCANGRPKCTLKNQAQNVF